MPAFTSGRRSLSRADLEPVLRIALIPLVAFLVGVVLALVYSLLQSTTYESRSQVVVSPASGFVDPARSDAFAPITTTVQQLALTQSVLSEAVRRLELTGVAGRTADELRGRIRLTINGDTPVLNVAAVDGNQDVASAMSTAETDALVSAVNAASKALVTTTTTTTTGGTTGPRGARSSTTTSASGTTAEPSGLHLDVFSKAEPQGKVQPRTGRNVLLGASAGLLIGCFVLAQLLAREQRRPG
jgi:capsular polysaccharide biosynthesis protein